MPGIRQGFVRHSAPRAAVPAATAAPAELATSGATGVAPVLCQLQLHISNFKGWRDAQHGSRSYERSLCCCAPCNVTDLSQLAHLRELHDGTPRFIFKDKVDLSDARRWKRCTKGAHMFIAKSSPTHPGAAAVLSQYLMQKHRVARFTFTSQEEVRLYLAPALLLLHGEHYRESFLHVLPPDIATANAGNAREGVLSDLCVCWIEHRHKRPPSAVALEASAAAAAAPQVTTSVAPSAATLAVPPLAPSAEQLSAEKILPPISAQASAAPAAHASHDSSAHVASCSMTERQGSASADSSGRTGGTPEPGGAATVAGDCTAEAAIAPPAAQLQQPHTSSHSVALKASQEIFLKLLRQQRDLTTEADKVEHDTPSTCAVNLAATHSRAAAQTTAMDTDTDTATTTDTDATIAAIANPGVASATASAPAASTSDSPALLAAQATLRDLVRQRIDCGRAADHRTVQEQLLVLTSLRPPSNGTLQRLGVGRDLLQAKKLLKEQGHTALYAQAKELLNKWKKSSVESKGEPPQRLQWGPGHPLEKGATVTVARRAGAGIKTRPGGAGRITAVNHDSCTYNVKLTINGTHEKQLAQHFVSASNVLITQARQTMKLPAGSPVKRAREEAAWTDLPSQHAQKKKKHKPIKQAFGAGKKDTAASSSSLSNVAKTNTLGGKATPYSKQQRGTLPTLLDMLSMGVVKAGDTLRALPRVAGRQYRLDGKLRADGRILMDPVEGHPTGKIFESPSGFCMFAIAYGRGQGKCNGWKSCFHVSGDGNETALDNLRKVAS